MPINLTSNLQTSVIANKALVKMQINMNVVRAEGRGGEFQLKPPSKLMMTIVYALWNKLMAEMFYKYCIIHAHSTHTE